MRKSLTLSIGESLVTVREIRVCDYLNTITALLFSVGDIPINQITPEQWDSAFLSGSDLIDCPDNATKMNSAELIRNAFIHVNRDFFKQNQNDVVDDEWQDESQTLSVLADNINEMCLYLISLKNHDVFNCHPDVFNYGWSFFHRVQELINEQ